MHEWIYAAEASNPVNTLTCDSQKPKVALDPTLISQQFPLARRLSTNGSKPSQNRDTEEGSEPFIERHVARGNSWEINVGSNGDLHKTSDLNITHKLS